MAWTSDFTAMGGALMRKHSLPMQVSSFFPIYIGFNNLPKALKDSVSCPGSHNQYVFEVEY